MENASKALLMAGGVLIGLLILSLAAYLFVDFGATSAKVHQQNEEKKLTEFNSKFTAYEGYYTSDENGNPVWQITIYDIITLAGYAKENNKYYEDVIDEQIKVTIKNKYDDISSFNSERNQSLLIAQYVDNNGTLTKFMCESIGYNNRGKVNSITFKAI